MKVLDKLLYRLYKSWTKRKLISQKVIIQVDGGICSQMHQYILGQVYADKGCKVRYDLSFYEEWGSDINQEFVRNFDLLKAFPYLTLKRPSDRAVKLYRDRFFYVGNFTDMRYEPDDFSFLQCTPPIYMGGYYVLPSEVWLPIFRRLFRITPGVLDAANEKLYREIEQTPETVAVHVRRGDLKAEVFAYGRPATIEYFRKSILFFGEKLNSPCFYFFSDEPHWVLQDMIPQLPDCYTYKVVDLNGSDKGYMDLFLIGRCQHQITSKGTLGKYGALLMDNPQKQVILCDDSTEYRWKSFYHNPVFF